ncbi:MAG: N-methyl-L-tryptophan oxidase [Planctomycetes bacterium]|nr:N-methyl-L-tryptophan oxidase [Planctomycetota bacterium]
MPTHRHYNTIILGAGTMGAAAAYHLARRNSPPLVLEQFELCHDRGSSHGRSRVIRKAYFEDPRYVPLLHAAYENWRELERESGQKLLHLVGCLNIGPPDHVAIKGVIESVRRHNLPHELLTAAEIKKRWPIFNANEFDVGLYEPDGGFVVPEVCIRTHANLATKHGATIHTDEQVLEWSVTLTGVLVKTTTATYESEKLILTAGPWLPQIAADLNLPLKVERQVQTWFMPKNPAPFTAPNMPSFIHFVEGDAYYGIPMRENEGVKVARHHAGEITTPETVNRSLTPADESNVRAYTAKYLPAANVPIIDAKICLYTNTPDDHFIIDRHPQHENVVIAGGFSGHGFKFAPIVGSILADLTLDGRTRRPIDFLSLNRFSV